MGRLSVGKAELAAKTVERHRRGQRRKRVVGAAHYAREIREWSISWATSLADGSPTDSSASRRWVLALASGRLPCLLGLFLLGALLIRRRPALSPFAWGVLLVVAITGNLALAALAAAPPLPASALGLLRDTIACVALPTGALAYAAILWGPLSKAGPVTDALVHAGRLSATHYLSQSLVLAAIFYGVGLGGWGTLGATAPVLVGGTVALTQLAISPAWRARFGHGPAEHALRSLDRLLGPRR